MQKTAMGYHTATSYDRHGLGGHYMDWHNQPSPYKTYPGVAPLGLPQVSDIPAQSLWELFALQDLGAPAPVFDRSLLARVLALSFSLTAESRQGGHSFHYRSVASAGALYPNELYVAADGIADLEPGLFHYGIRARDLAPLRTGSVGRFAAEACGDPDDPCAALFLISGIFFRSAWKYRTRALRYVLLDAGHLLLNILLALQASGIPGALVYGFDDTHLNRFLGLDPRLEACLAGVKIPGRTAVPARKASEISDLPSAFTAASRVGASEVVYPEIEAGYRSGLNPGLPGDPPPDMLRKIGLQPEHWSTFESPEPSEPETAYPHCVFNRRSRRNYINTPLDRQTFGRLLDLACRAARDMHNPETAAASTIVLGLLVGRVNEVPSGFYLLDPFERRIGLVSGGDFRSQMTAVCLDQDWLANAGVHFLCMTNLAELDRHWGPRGYRYAMLTAGGIGQALYLGAAALGIGCCGIGALYDGEARGLLGLNAESALLYLVALGVVKKL